MDLVYNEVAKCSKILMFKEPFYGLFLSSLSKELNTSIPTACVTPSNINIKLIINPEFWATLDENTKLAVLKHELLHIVMFHLETLKKYSNKKLFNIAADLEINQYIESSYKGETWNGLEYNQGMFKKLNLEPKKGTKYYYEKLLQEKNNNPDSDLSKFIDEFSENEHTLWKEFEKLNDTEKKLIQKQIEHQLKETAKLKKDKGYIPAELKDLITSLFEEKPPVLDWKAYIRRFGNKSNKILTKKTRQKPNKRFYGNPALKITPKKTMLVAIDTSGSVSNSEIIEFFNEIHNIYKTGTSVTIIECDTCIQRIYEYKGEYKKNQFNVVGRGGTSFNPVIDFIKENKNKYNSLIYLTDGEASAPKNVPLIPILWVHSSNSDINENLPGFKIKIKR